MGIHSFENRLSSQFSRMRSNGCSFILGVGGVFVARVATVRNCPQPFASFRVRAHGRAFEGCCKRGRFWRFLMLRSLVSCGRCSTLSHPNMFQNVSKAILCDRRNTFAPFSEDELALWWQAQGFRRVHFHFAWQAQHFRRVVLRVFSKSNCQGCVKWWQRANCVAGVTFCEM